MATEETNEGSGEGLPLVVFDCNLFLQAVGKGGNHAWRCLQLAIEGKLIVCMSEAVLSEIDDVLRRPIVREAFPMLDDAHVDALIDERLARKMCAVHLSYLEVVCTAELLADPATGKRLGTDGQAQAIFHALQGARMNVPREHLESIVSLIGVDHAALCPSLPRSFVLP